MTKPIDSIRVDILPNIMRQDNSLGNRIAAAIRREITETGYESDTGWRSAFSYSSSDKGTLYIEVTAAERLPVAVIDDTTLLDTLAAAAMDRGMPLQEFIKSLAKEYK